MHGVDRMIKKAKVINEEGFWFWNNRSFPTFAAIIFVLGVLWFLNGIGILKTKVPWFPAILIILSLGWIINHYKKR